MVYFSLKGFFTTTKLHRKIKDHMQNSATAWQTEQ
jgi:hypothetical protein